MAGPSLPAVIMTMNALSAVLAWSVVRRTREHVWAAAFVTWMLASDVARLWTMRAHGTHPLHGFVRLGWFLDQVLVTSWTFPFLAVCAIYFLRRRDIAIAALIGWATLSVAIIASYPVLVGAKLLAMYRVLFWFGLASSWLMILLGVFRDRTLKPRLAHLVLILYAATDLVGAAFPFLKQILPERWDDVRWLNLVTFTVCGAVQAIELGRAKPVEEATA